MNYPRLRAVADELMERYEDLASKVEIRDGEISMTVSPSAPRELHVILVAVGPWTVDSSEFKRYAPR